MYIKGEEFYKENKNTKKENKYYSDDKGVRILKTSIVTLSRNGEKHNLIPEFKGNTIYFTINNFSQTLSAWRNQNYSIRTKG